MPATPRKGRRRRFWAWVVVLSLVSLVSGVLTFLWWLGSDDFQARATAAATTLVEAQTGERFEVGRIEVELWPPAAEITGLRLWHEPTGDTIVSVRRVRAPLVLRGWTPAVGRLEIEAPQVAVHLEADGKLRELRGLKRQTPPERLPWDSLLVTDGSVHLTLVDGEIALTGVSITPIDGPVSDVAAHLKLKVGTLEDETDLSVRGAHIGPDAIEIPALAIDSRLLHVTGTARAPLQGAADARLELALDAADLSSALPAGHRVRGAVSVDVVARADAGVASADAVVLVRGLGLDAPHPDGVNENNYSFGDLLAEVHATPEAIDVTRARLHFAGGVVTATGRVKLPELLLEDAVVIGEGLSMEQVLISIDSAPTPWVDFDGDLELHAAGRLAPLELTGPFELVVKDLHVGDGPVSRRGTTLLLDIPRAHAIGQLDLTGSHMVLRSNHVRGPRNRGSCVVDIGFGAKGPMELTATLDPADLSDFGPLSDTELRGTGRVSGRFWGPFDEIRFEGDAELVDFSVMGIPYADHITARLVSPEKLQVLQIVDAQATRRSTRYHGDWAMDFRDPLRMDTDVEVDEGRVEDVVSMFVDVEGMKGDLTGTLSLHGPLYDLDGGAHLDLKNVDLWGERFPIGTADGYMDRGLFTLDDLRITRHNGHEGLILRGSVQRAWALQMELLADGFALDRLDAFAAVEAPLSGDLSAHVRIDNTLFEPSPHGRLALQNVRYAGNPIDDSVVRFETHSGVAQYQGRLAGGTVAVRGTLGLWDEQPYELDAFFANFPAHFFYPTAADGGKVEALLTGSVALEGNFGEEPSPVKLEANVKQAEVAWAHHRLRNPRPWRYYQDGTEFSLESFSLVGGRTDLRIDRAANTGGVLQVEGGGLVDLDLLRAVTPDLLRSEGLAEVDLTVTGSGSDVDALVTATARASLMRHASFPGAFEDVVVDVLATSDKYTLTLRESGLGGGSVQGHGWIYAKDWVPTRWDLRATATDAQLQWVDYLPPAIGDARLSFDGPVGALLLSGDVQIGEMAFTDRIDWEDWVVEFQDEVAVSSAPSDEEPYFSMNVHLTADRTIGLRNNVAEGTASADLRVIGDTSRPGLTGWVRVEDGVAFLQDREFRMERGHLAFRDPWTWDPDLDFDLVTDITSRERRYRVTYRVLGPFSDWRTETRSEPAMSQADVNALLWFGVTADELEDLGELYTAIGQGVADMVIADLFVSGRAAGAEDARLLIDRIDIATGVNGRGEYSPDPRLVVEKRLPELGDVQLTGEMNMTRWEDQFYRVDGRITDTLSLSGWYATRQRDSVGGALGVDLRARWEFD